MFNLKSTRAAIAALALLICVLLAMRSTAQVPATEQNTGMADPVALVAAFDRFVAGGFRTRSALVNPATLPPSFRN